MPEFSLGIGILLLILAAAAAGVAGWFASRQQCSVLKRRLADLERQIGLHAQSLSGLTAGALGLDKRLGRVEAEERALSHRQDTFENQQIPDRPYHHAIKLVQQGAGASRLVDELDLSRSEAELIVRLHGVNPD